MNPYYIDTLIGFLARLIIRRHRWQMLCNMPNNIDQLNTVSSAHPSMIQLLTTGGSTLKLVGFRLLNFYFAPFADFGARTDRGEWMSLAHLFDAAFCRYYILPIVR